MIRIILWVLSMVSFVILAILWLIEFKIQKITVKIGLLFGFVASILVLSSYCGFKMGKSMTENDIFNEYAREFSDMTSNLYELSETNQHDRLKQVLKVLHNELPAAIARHQYAFVELHYRLFTERITTDKNGRQVKQWVDPLDDLAPENDK
jgi:hypothetical protein